MTALRPLSPRHRGSVPLAALLLVALTSGAAGAAVDPDDKVAASELPTATQVAAVYPAFAGGSREVLRNRTPETPTRNCLGYRTPIKATGGRWAFYLDADGEDLYWSGEETPAVFRYRMSTHAEARTAFRLVRRHHARCVGTFTDTDGSVVRRALVPVPDLAAQQLAVRTFNRTPNVVTTWSSSRTVDVWVRQGRDLVKTMVQAEEYRPNKARAVELTRITLTR